MRTFGRIIVIVFGLMLVALSVLLLLMAAGVLTGSDLNAVTGYRGALDWLAERENPAAEMWLRIVVGLAGLVVAALAALALLRWLTPIPVEARLPLQATPHAGEPHPGSRRAFAPGDPRTRGGQVESETVLRSSAVRHLVEGAVREAGAWETDVELDEARSGLAIRCSVVVRRERNLREQAAAVRERIVAVMRAQQLDLESVEVTVTGVR